MLFVCVRLKVLLVSVTVFLGMSSEDADRWQAVRCRVLFSTLVTTVNVRNNLNFECLSYCFIQVLL